MRKKFSLVGVDGNAFSVMAYVKTAMREAGFSRKEMSEYIEDCMRGDYDRLLILSEEMIERCNDALGLDQRESRKPTGFSPWVVHAE